MNFNLANAIELLQRTPMVLETLLNGLSKDWTSINEGKDTWSPYDVVGHLIIADKTDWMPRLEIILSSQTDKTFPAFDRFAQFQESQGKNLSQLLNEFNNIRKESIENLKSRNLTQDDLQKTGVHPALGNATLQQLLATWVAHDMDHIFQIVRVMAKHYKEDVGPWVEYLRILKA